MPKYNPKHNKKHRMRNKKSHLSKKHHKNEKSFSTLSKIPKISQTNKNLAREITNQTNKNLAREIRTLFVNYNFKELYLWLCISSIHPNNSQFQMRFEFLITILLSINDKDFSKQSVSRSTFSTILNQLFNKYSRYFVFWDDTEPFDQLKLIPIFYKSKKYYYFHGVEERTYESWHALLDFYVTNHDLKESSHFEFLYDFSLSNQTRIIEKLVSINESKSKGKDILIPSQKYYNQLNSLFLVDIPKNYLQSDMIKLGNTKSQIYNGKIFNLISKGIVFNKILIENPENSKNAFLLLPQIHLNALYCMFFEKLEKDASDFSYINHHLKQQIIEKSINFFGQGKIVNDVLDSTEISCLLKDSCIIFNYDCNLIFFFWIDLYPTSKISDFLKRRVDIFEEIKTNIKAEKEVIFSNLGGDSKTFKTKYLNFKCFLITEQLDLKSSHIKLNYKINEDIETILFKDIAAYFEFLPNPLSFLKFFKEKKEIDLKYRTFDDINKLGIYLGNNNSFPHHGKKFSIWGGEHIWKHYIDDYLYEKFQDPIYNYIDGNFLDTYNKINKIDNNLNMYEIYSTKELEGADVGILTQSLIFVQYPSLNDITDRKDMKYAIRYFAPMICEYFIRNKHVLENLFRLNGHNLRIKLKPINLHGFKNPSKYNRYLKLINKERPALILIKNLEKYLDIIFLFNTNLWIDKFKDSNNKSAQLYIFKNLIEELIKKCDSTIDKVELGKKTKKYIDKCRFEGKSDYSFVSLESYNPQFENYPKPIRIPNQYYENVIEKVEEFIYISGTVPESLDVLKTKKLYNKIVGNLFSNLRSSIQTLNKKIVIEIYRYYELLLAFRKSCSYDLVMKERFFKHNEMNEKYQSLFQKVQNISNLISTVRYLVEIIIINDKFGEYIITDDKLCEIITISHFILDYSQKSDLIHSDLIPFNISVNNSFNYEESITLGKYDHEQYSEKELKFRLENVKNSIYREKDELITKNDEIIRKKYRELFESLDSKSKDQLGFSFSNLFRVLFTLTRISDNDYSKFPIKIFLLEDLNSKIIQQYKKFYLVDEENEIIDEVNQIIDFITIDLKSNKIDDLYLFSSRLKEKNRLSLCPLVSFDTNQIIYGNEACLTSYALWQKYISSGISPYTMKKKDPIKVILKEISQLRAKEFEEICFQKTKDVLNEKNVIKNLKNFQNISKNFQKRPECGEIDLLAINVKNKKIFVLDMKSYYQKTRPSDIRNEIRDVYERNSKKHKSNLTHLKKKSGFVKKNLREFLNYFGADVKAKWRVIDGFVVKYNIHSLYYTSNPTMIIHVKDLKRFLQK